MFKVFTILCFFIATSTFAQDIMRDMNSGGVGGTRHQELFTENIQVISNSKKIFIISNENRKLTKGDFISLLIDNNLGARALVAKIDNDRAGIKILKIYSLAEWSKMVAGRDVQILIGDDSYYQKPKEANDKDEFDQIKNQEDLFKDDLDIDDFGDETENTRALRTDNLVSAAWGHFRGINADEESVNHTQFTFGWAHQISDNIYVEGLFGYSKLTDFPSATGIQTVVTNFSARAKYNFKTPLYTYVMPYVGMELISVNSPEAGKGSDLTPTEKANELRVLDKLLPSKTNLIFGVTILRRLVPAWFLKADIQYSSKASLSYNIGVAIEF